jgi:hypothetical protein
MAEIIEYRHAENLRLNLSFADNRCCTGKINAKL